VVQAGSVVQRHASWEHALMGNTKPADFEKAVGKASNATRQHVLESEAKRARYFQIDPYSDPNLAPSHIFDNVKVLKLSGSSLWVTYGELNALADYLPNGREINAMSAGDLLPILQFIRREVARTCEEYRKSGETDDSVANDGEFKGAQEATWFQKKLASVSS